MDQSSCPQLFINAELNFSSKCVNFVSYAFSLLAMENLFHEGLKWRLGLSHDHGDHQCLLILVFSSKCRSIEVHLVTMKLFDHPCGLSCPTKMLCAHLFAHHELHEPSKRSHHPQHWVVFEDCLRKRFSSINAIVEHCGHLRPPYRVSKIVSCCEVLHTPNVFVEHISIDLKISIPM